MFFRNRLSSAMGLLGAAALGLTLAVSALPLNSAAAAPVNQAAAPNILILPIDQANFLPGQKFDVQIEVWADTLPSDFAVKVNGKDASDMFGSKPVSSNWQFDASKGNALTYTYRTGLSGKITSQATTWRQVSIATPGDYKIEVTAGGSTKAATWTVRDVGTGKAKNIIFFLGDGMATAMRTAARVVSRGLNAGGKYNGALNMDTMPAFGELSTNGYDAIITDSANSMSAYMTGQKGVVNSMGVYANTSDDNNDDPQVQTFGELAKQRGMAIGTCVTSRITDATPAATWGHTRRRGDEDILIDQALKLNYDVLLGGGSIFFLPKTTPGSERRDNEDTFKAFQDAGYTVITSAADLSKVDTSKTGKLLGIFSLSHENSYLDRTLYPQSVQKNGPDQPGLMAECKAAIDILSKNDKGFFLMVEGSDIDKQEHMLSWERAVGETIEFDNVVGYAKDWAKKNGDNTLIAVTADHAHAFDVYGTVDLAAYDKITADMKAAAAAPATQAAATAAATMAATAAAPGRLFPTPDPRLNAIGEYQNAGFPDYQPDPTTHFPASWNVKYPLAVTWGDHPPYTDNFRISPLADNSSFLPSGAGAFAQPIPNGPSTADGVYFNGNLNLGDTQDVHTLQDVPVTAYGPGSECFNGWHENTDVFFCLAAAISLDPRKGATADAPLAQIPAGAALPALLLTVAVGGSVTRRKFFLK